MTWHPIQETFVSGEITPALSSQISSQVYRSGLKTCLNMLPTHTGAVTTRPGLEHVETVRENYTGEARVIPIDFGLEQRVVLVLTDEQMNIYSDQSFAQQGNYVTNSSFRDGAQGWTILGTGTQPNTKFADAYYLNRDYSGFVGPGDNHWVVLQADVATLPYWSFAYAEQFFDVPVDAQTPRLKVVIFAPPSDYWSAHEGTFWLTDANTETIIEEVAIDLQENETYVFDQEITLPGDFSGQMKFLFAVQQDNTISYPDQTPLRLALNSMSLYYSTGSVDEIPPLVSPYATGQLDAIQFVQNPYTNSVVFTHPDVTPWELTRDDLGVFSFAPIVWAIGGQGVNPHWVTNPNATDGYPRAVGASSGRCIFGGTYMEPQSIWSTAPGETGWDNILLPNDPVASDPLWYTMTALGYIQWIKGGTVLLHGTSNGEHTVSALSALVESSDLQVSEQSTNGSAHVQAEKVGHEVFYVGGNRADVRTMVFSDELQNYRSDNMTLASPQITRGKVKRLAYGRHPFKIVWCCLRDGTLAAMSYDPGAKMSGWHRHETSGGSILDVAEGRLAGVDKIYCAVRRSLSTGTNLTLEAMQTYEDGKVVAMDRYTIAQMDAPSDTITGLERFESDTVWVQTTTKLYDPLPVINGQVTLPETISETYIVGKAFHQEIETMPAIPVPNGGSLGSAKTFSRIGLRLYESSLPIVNGVQYKQKQGKSTPTGWGDYASGTLADYHQQHLGWDYLEPIKVEQDQPQKLTITGIFGKLTDEDI